jgi:hypothetical protein
MEATMLINLTPHAITIIGTSGESVTIPPSGAVARVLTQEENVGSTVAGGVTVPIVSRTFGKVEGVPSVWDREHDIIVSTMVLEALRASGDVSDTAGIFAPDTGPTAIRENGQVVAIRRLICA